MNSDRKVIKTSSTKLMVLDNINVNKKKTQAVLLLIATSFILLLICLYFHTEKGQSVPQDSMLMVPAVFCTESEK